jgi:hypothetical protein
MATTNHRHSTAPGGFALARRISIGLVILMLVPGVSGAQQWTSIVPGKTTRDEVEKFAGAGTESPEGRTYTNSHGARSLAISYSLDGTVTQLVVVPASALREADITSAFGLVHKKYGKSGSGREIVDYPLGGARVEFNDDGTVYSVIVRGGVTQHGINAEGVLRSLLGGGKP